jgi:hypothetical protein
MPFRVQQHVIAFDITVYNISRVKMLQTQQCLINQLKNTNKVKQVNLKVPS